MAIASAIVCGGRDFGCFKRDGKLVVVKPERDFIHAVLTAVAGYDEDGSPRPLKIIHGDCPTGADRVAQAWADKHMMPFKRFPAKWDEFGKAAGPKRNQQMADFGANFCIAFPGGAGTKDMVTRADEAGIPVFIPSWHAR
jgi:hypothetical protein